MCQWILSGNVPIDWSSFLLHKQYFYFNMIKTQDQPTGCSTSRTTTTTSTALTITTARPTNMDPNRTAVLVLSTHRDSNKPFIVDFNGKYHIWNMSCFFRECWLGFWEIDSHLWTFPIFYNQRIAFGMICMIGRMLTKSTKIKFLVRTNHFLIKLNIDRKNLYSMISSAKNFPLKYRSRLKIDLKLLSEVNI